MFWRASDAARLSTLKYGEQGSGGKEKCELTEWDELLEQTRFRSCSGSASQRGAKLSDRGLV